MIARFLPLRLAQFFGCCVALSFLQLAPNSCAHAATSDQVSSFLIFDSLLYRNKPAMDVLGLKPVRVVARFWAPGTPMNQVNEAGTSGETAKLGDYQGLVYIDIEHWPILNAPAAIAQHNIAKLARVAEIVRAGGHNRQVGYYSVLPERIYWPIIQQDEAALAAWRESNRLSEKIARHVDVIMPSLYTFYNDPKGWALYARAMLVEARRYGKPVYAFISPEFETADPRLKGTLVPAEFWRQELALCRELADGVVLWGGWQGEWDEQAPWWDVTKEFIKATLPSR